MCESLINDNLLTSPGEGKTRGPGNEVDTCDLCQSLPLEYYILYVAKIDCPSFSTLNFGEFANSVNTYSML